MTASAALACTLAVLVPTLPPLAPSGPGVPLIAGLTGQRAPGEEILVIETVTEPARRLVDFAPGDYSEWAADVTNTAPGPVAVAVAVDAIGEHPLTEHPTSSLDLIIDLCADRLDTRIAADGVTIVDCSSDERRLGQGSASCPEVVLGSTVIPSGATVGIIVTASLPATAGNDFENTTGQLAVRIGLDEGDDSVGNESDGCTPAPAPSAYPITGAPITGGSGSSGPVAGPPAPRAAGPAPTARTSRPSASGLPFTGTDVLASLVGAGTVLVMGMILLPAHHPRRRRPPYRRGHS